MTTQQAILSTTRGGAEIIGDAMDDVRSAHSMLWQSVCEDAIASVLSCMEWDADDADEMVAELQAEVASWFASQDR